jgi:hypothetical protein
MILLKSQRCKEAWFIYHVERTECVIVTYCDLSYVKYV